MREQHLFSFEKKTKCFKASMLHQNSSDLLLISVFQSEKPLLQGNKYYIKIKKVEHQLSGKKFVVEHFIRTFFTRVILIYPRTV